MDISLVLSMSYKGLKSLANYRKRDVVCLKIICLTGVKMRLMVLLQDAVASIVIIRNTVNMIEIDALTKCIGIHLNLVVQIILAPICF